MILTYLICTFLLPMLYALAYFPRSVFFLFSLCNGWFSLSRYYLFPIVFGPRPVQSGFELSLPCLTLGLHGRRLSCRCRAVVVPLSCSCRALVTMQACGKMNCKQTKTWKRDRAFYLRSRGVVKLFKKKMDSCFSRGESGLWNISCGWWGVSKSLIWSAKGVSCLARARVCVCGCR